MKTTQFLNSFEIAPGKRNYHWTALSPKLQGGGADAATWEKAVMDFYRGRLQSRYLDAITSIRESGKGQGEGFAVMAIQCSLIEFLESCYQGINYKFKKPQRPHEYKGSGKLFVSFLTKRPPFKAKFTPALAREFYESVRCGVLHEASTKGAWRIWMSSGSAKIIDPDKRIVFRDDFQNALETFIENYCAQVVSSPKLQRAFVRKFNYLCN